MKILIADDEGLARARLRSLIEELDGYQVVGEAGSGREAVELAVNATPDVVLLDIRMPGMGGLEAAGHLAKLAVPPAVIFTTAYDEHALAAFEAQAVDYLLKPIRGERLARALEKAATPTRPQLAALEETHGTRLAAHDNPQRTHISAHVRGGVRLVALDEVVYFQSDHKYVTVHFDGGEVLIEESLKALEEEFADRLVRIHRNALVMRERLVGMERDADGPCLVRLRGTDQRLEVSRRHSPALRRLLAGG